MPEAVKKKQPGGRPRIEFTPEQVEQIHRLAEIQCTVKEIAYIMGVSREVIDRRYTEDVELGRAQGKLALRRAQWRNAVEKDNVSMQIWLGKNVLSQTDSPVNEEDNQILPWSD